MRSSRLLTSSLGGRCTSTTSTVGAPSSLKKKPLFKPPPSGSIQQRSLQDAAQLCATYAPSCPTSLCTCLFSPNSSVSSCSSEMRSVCTNDQLSSCLVTPEEMPLYQNVFCPMASCLVEVSSGGRKMLEECYCDYHRDACDFNPAVNGEDCDVADCCDGQPLGMKSTCLKRGEVVGSDVSIVTARPTSSSPTAWSAT